MHNGDKRARFTLRLPEKLLIEIGKEAVAYGVSINALILQALWERKTLKKETQETKQ